MVTKEVAPVKPLVVHRTEVTDHVPVVGTKEGRGLVEDTKVVAQMEDTKGIVPKVHHQVVVTKEVVLSQIDSEAEPILLVESSIRVLPELLLNVHPTEATDHSRIVQNSMESERIEVAMKKELTKPHEVETTLEEPRKLGQLEKRKTSNHKISCTSARDFILEKIWIV